MSLNFKNNFDEFRERNAEYGKAATEAKPVETFAAPSLVRNICFIWPDGKKKFLNYAYLISGEYLPEESAISLIFTSDTITIKGFKLEGLFDDLIQHLPSFISCSDPRYNETLAEPEIIINDIAVTKNE